MALELETARNKGRRSFTVEYDPQPARAMPIIAARKKSELFIRFSKSEAS